MRPSFFALVPALAFALACGSATEEPAPAPGGSTPGPATIEPAPPGEPSTPRLRLAAVVATSGDGAAMLDGDASTGWKPAGDPRGEGVLLRFEEPTKVGELRFTACANSGPFTLTPFYNGTEGDVMDVPAGSSGGGGDVERSVRSVFLRVDAGTPCLAELTMTDGEKQLALAAPRAIAGTVTASSTLDPADAYHPSYAFDSRVDFGWVEGSAGLGVGETLTVKLDRPLALAKLELWNGYQRSQDHFDKNARIKKLAISVGGAREEVVVEQDTFGPQLVPFGGGVESDTITLEIIEAEPGTKYKDLVISELRFWDAEGPVRVAVRGGEQRAGALKKAVAGTAVAPLVDTLWVGACNEFGERTLKLRSDNSFVWYEPLDTSLEIFDGAWVPKGAAAGGAQIQLYGRRHLSEESWEPYSSENGMKESTRIGGGKPVFHAVADMDAATFASEVEAVRGAWGRDCDYDQTELGKQGAVIVRDSSITDILVPKG